MKNLKAPPRLLSVLAVAVFSAQILPAATPIWNAASGGNWSVNGNWSTGIFPQSADDVQFGDTGAGSQNTMDTAFTINSLTYNHDNGATHTTLLNPGLTLSIARGNTGDILSVGSTSGATAAGTLVPVAIQGPGATLSLSGTGDIVVRQGNGTAGGHMATLDMSGLDTFNATVGRLLVGQANAGAAVNRPSGTLFLAKTNTITLSGAAPQVVVQDGASNANGGTVSLLSLGQANFLYADQFRLGGQKGNGNVNFNAAFTNPSLVIRNTDQASRATQIAFGDNSFAASGNTAVANVDLTLGTVDILATTVYVARGNPGGGTSTGQAQATVSFAAGTFDVSTLEVGFQTATTANGITTGTLNVNNNTLVTTNVSSGLVSTGAVLSVNTTMRLARTNGSTGAVTGTLNVNGGTVLANSIVAGGGNSTINLNTGSLLVVSNNAGTLSAPIRNFTIGDAAMTLPALNAGTVVAVSNLVAGGSQNTINISSVPPIGSYPATFTLVSYKTGGGGNFVRGSLPAATPSYAGTLLDVGNGVIQLQLTAGPLTDLSTLWTGATDNNWDTSTFNWSSHGIATNFFAGATPTFDDTSSQKTVNLATAISSGTVTVNNSAAAYDFSGPGNISGASSLVKNGSQTLILENQGVDNFGSVSVNAGTLQIGTGDVNGEIASLNITNNASMVVNRSGPLELSSVIAGIGSLTKIGNGTLTLSGASTYTGVTTLTAGGLEIDGSLSGNGAINTAAGTVLSGNGTVGGPVTVAGKFNPGAINAPGVFTANGAMTFSTGSTLTFDLNGSNPTPPASDSVTVGGNLNLNNNAVTANFLGVPLVGNTYPLFTYSGTLSGSLNPTVAGTHFTVALDTISTPGTVNLQVTGGTGANLKWTGAIDTTWDSTVTNWTDQVSAAPSLFYSGDNILLDDTATSFTLAINQGSVYPATITNNSDGGAYVISGAGKISGSASIVKLGGSTLTISTANDFTGGVDIQAGTLKVGSGTALGSGTTGTTVESGATLDINGQPIGGEAITVSGHGVNDGGAIINFGGVQNTALRSVTLAGDTYFGGTGTWAINNSGGAGSLSTGGQPFKLTKVGANLVGLQNLTTVDAALTDIEVQQGILEFNGLTASMGDPNFTNYVDAGATEQFTSDQVVWNKHFNLTGNGTATTINNNTAATTEFAGATELHGGVVFNIGGTMLTISGDISGDGGLIKNGASPMVLTGNNTYTGDTTINAGALRVGGNATIISSNIVIASGAALTATGRVDATFTLGANQTLSGNGVINGQLTTLAGSTVAPGIGAVGALTVSNAVVLGGTNTMELDQDNKTNDVLNTGSTLTYGGVLNLVNLTSPLTNGASFKLFKASSFSGSFASIVPATPGAGQTWNISALATSGTISVVGGAANPTTNATITSVKAVGTNLVIHGTNNNVPNTLGRYVVLTSTNLALPLSSWTPVITNQFIGGAFDYTNPIVNTIPQQYIGVKVIP